MARALLCVLSIKPCVGGVAYKYIGIGIVIGIVQSILYHSYSIIGKPLREGHPRRRIPESVALHLCHTSYSAREIHLNPIHTSGDDTATSELDTLLSARDNGCLAVLRDQQARFQYHLYLPLCIYTWAAYQP
jgi:hypothetical protein